MSRSVSFPARPDVHGPPSSAGFGISRFWVRRLLATHRESRAVADQLALPNRVAPRPDRCGLVWNLCVEIVVGMALALIGRWWWGADGRTSAASSEPADCPFVQWPMPEPPNDHEIPPSPRRRRERDTLQPIATAPRDAPASASCTGHSIWSPMFIGTGSSMIGSGSATDFCARSGGSHHGFLADKQRCVVGR